MQALSEYIDDLCDRVRSLEIVGNLALSGDIDFLHYQMELMPTTPPRALISEYAAEKRIMPPNTPFPGAWDNGRTPYLIEIMNNMSPHSPITHQAVEKGVQLGFTACAENIMAYYMDECPTAILYVSATERLLEKWASKRLEPVIDSCGIRSKITAAVDNPKSRRTGDKVFSKQFVGGSLDMASAQSASSLRSDSIRLLIRDEVDAAPKLLKTGEGDWLEVSEGRTNAFGARKKIFDFSTPTTFENSEIERMVLSGDQRQYRVPCPLCGKYQKLVFGSEQSNHGLKAETEAGDFVRAYYLCDYCHDAFFNHHKTSIMAKGRWEPTIQQTAAMFPTYQISSLYSPVGMLSWSEFWLKYLRALETPDGMRSFTNLYIGLAYKETGSRPKLENVIELRGGYREKEIPNGVLYLTVGIDVQTGSLKDKTNPPRLEMEVLGIGAGYRSWSIAYLVFDGPVLDPYSGAWEDLNDFAVAGGLTFKRKADGRVFAPSLIFVDSGDGNVTDIVYRFASRWDNTSPSKGFGALKRHAGDKGLKGDVAGPSNFRRYRTVKVQADIYLREISTNYYKGHIYNNLKIPRQPDEPQRAGFCDFPIDRSESYFKMLTAEEKRTDGSFHCPSGRRNEALDCRVMALCAADVWLDNRMLEYKAAVKARGGTPVQIEMVNHRMVIDRLVKAMDPANPKTKKKTKKQP